jgi:hypothetical protein
VSREAIAERFRGEWGLDMPESVFRLWEFPDLWSRIRTRC